MLKNRLILEVTAFLEDKNVYRVGIPWDIIISISEVPNLNNVCNILYGNNTEINVDASYDLLIEQWEQYMENEV